MVGGDCTIFSEACVCTGENLKQTQAFCVCSGSLQGSCFCLVF